MRVLAVGLLLGALGAGAGGCGSPAGKPNSDPARVYGRWGFTCPW